jgi:hypothetical protein
MKLQYIFLFIDNDLIFGVIILELRSDLPETLPAGWQVWTQSHYVVFNWIRSQVRISAVKFSFFWFANMHILMICCTVECLLSNDDFLNIRVVYLLCCENDTLYFVHNNFSVKCFCKFVWNLMFTKFANIAYYSSFVYVSFIQAWGPYTCSHWKRNSDLQTCHYIIHWQRTFVRLCGRDCVRCSPIYINIVKPFVRLRPLLIKIPFTEPTFIPAVWKGRIWILD